MEVDALMLANAAETRGNLLFALAAGWMRCWPPGGTKYPYDRPITVASVVRVGWNDTNEQHQFELTIRDSEETIIGGPVLGEFTVGREPDLTRGMSQVIVFSGSIPTKLERPGIYTAVLAIDGTEMKRIQFESLQGPPRSQ